MKERKVLLDKFFKFVLIISKLLMNLLEFYIFKQGLHNQLLLEKLFITATEVKIY